MIKFVTRLNLSGTRVDRESGVIKGVSLIALGDARGHGKAVDEKTLETVRDCAREYPNGLRVKFNPNTFTHGAGMLAGYIKPSTIKIADGKTVGDMHLYRSLPNEAKEYLYELAETTPGNIGLSIEFTGDDEEIKGEKFARCGEIFAATIVDLPAANPTGLFAANDDDEKSKKPYGDVEYADPGYQSDKKKRYPIDTEDHVRAAWSYINQGDNAGKYSSGDLAKVKSKIKSAAKSHGIEISEDMDMTTEEMQKLTAEITGTLKAGFAEIKQMFQEQPPPKKKKNGDGEEDEPDKEEMAAAGVTDADDEATKKTKLAAYRASQTKPVSAMSAKELTEVVQAANMQFFRKTGGNPVRLTVEPRRDGELDPFEKRIKQHMEAGAKTRGLAIMRARKDSGADYNAWRAKQNPLAVQRMVRT